MRYSVEHKEESRNRILEEARLLFRSKGLEGASIDQVMGAAGLTRGTFYAHFSSKEDLASQVLAIEAGLTKSLRIAAEADEPAAAALAVVANYLDPAQRDNNAAGCPLIAHPVDAIRGGDARKEAYTRQLSSLIAEFEAVLGDSGAYDTAILLAVLAVGGALLSAASADSELADRIEEVCLRHIGEAL